MTTVRSLCSGYGGLDLAVQATTGATVVDHAETDVNAAKVLETHWPGLENLGDVTAIDWSVLEPTDIICAGFPCQPVSQAGKRKASDDKRWLWPHIGDAVRVLRPRLVVLENVSGLLLPWRDGRWWRPAPVEQVLGELAALGYDACWRSLRAADVGAPHRRERVFIVATDADRERLTDRAEPDGQAEEPALTPPRRGDVDRRHGAVADSDRVGRARGRWASGGITEPQDGHDTWGPYAATIARWERLTRPVPPPRDDRGRLSPIFVEWMMGLPAGWVTGVGLTRTAELRMLGNGVVPQQATCAITSILRRLEVAA